MKERDFMLERYEKVKEYVYSQHAKLSSLHAYKYLKESGLFKTTEIDDITYAIRQHSKKESFDSPLC